MVEYEITDCRKRKIRFYAPVRISLISSSDAPADSLSAVFAVEGQARELLSVRVKYCGRTVFSGEIDEQTEYSDGTDQLLEIKARSREAVLLDNEARAQTYYSPSMPLLMSRHFLPLGFTGFIGEEKAFNGQFDIVKGMSEWEVLEGFCKRFTKTVPVIRGSTIDISGENDPKEITISKEKIISQKKTLRRSAVISEIYSRTSIGSGYEKRIVNDMAGSLGITRRRFVNDMNNRLTPVLSAKELIEKTNSAARKCETTISGFFVCSAGDILRIEGENELMRIKEIHYSFSSDGETTKIYSEVIG